MRDGRPQLVTERARQPAHRQPLSTLHVIAFDRDDGNLVEILAAVLAAADEVRADPDQCVSQGWDDRGVSFRIKDIEKHGPGMIVDVNV